MNDRAYWNRHARGYDLSLRVLGRPLPRMLELVTDAVRGRARVLEVAAGTGIVTSAIAPVVGEVMATDYAEQMVHRLSARVRDAGLSNVRCEQADLFALPYEPESFDAIVAANVFHLLLDVYGALRAMRRVLRPGGRIVFPTFCHGETLRSAALSRVLALTGFPVRHRYSVRELRETARWCGLKVEHSETIPGPIPIGYAHAVWF